jgi:hypothetical protein
VTKLTGIVLATAALVVAAYLVLARRPLPRGAGRGPVGARFVALVAACVALLGGERVGEAKPASQPAASRPASQPATALSRHERRLLARAEWRQVRDNWQGVTTLPGLRGQEIAAVVAARRSDNQKLLKRLVAARLVSAAAASALNDIYADRVFHYLRRESNVSCYLPGRLGGRQRWTRDAIEGRLALLAGYVSKGIVRGPSIDALERQLKQQLEIVLRISDAWERQSRLRDQGFAAHRKEEAEILDLLVRDSREAEIRGYQERNSREPEIKDEVKLRPGLEEAMRLIRLMYVTGP